jgi:hypothetical protein
MSDKLAIALAEYAEQGHFSLDDVLQHQLLEGGHIDTVVMELGFRTEKEILFDMEQAYGFPAVAQEEMAHIPLDMARLVSVKLAETLGVIPLHVRQGRLAVACAVEPDVAILEEVAHMVSLEIVAYVTTEFRFAMALERLYGLPASPRMKRLFHKNHADSSHEPGISFSAQSADKQDPAPSQEIRFGVDNETLLEQSGWEVQSVRVTSHVVADTHSRQPEDSPLEQSEPVQAESDLLSENLELDATAAAQPIRVDIERRLLLSHEREQKAQRQIHHRRQQERIRWTIDDAIAELHLADGRDMLVDVLVRYAHRNLNTVAVFVPTVRGGEKIFLCWDLVNPVLAPEEMNSSEIRASNGSMLHRALEHGAYILGPMPEQDPLVPWLGYRPRNAVLMPISISGKVVSVLYGDCGEEFISPSALSELHMVAPYFGKRLKRLFVTRRRELIASLDKKKGIETPSRLLEENQVTAFATESASPLSDAADSHATVEPQSMSDESPVEGSQVEGSQVEGSQVEGSQVEGSQVEGSQVEGSQVEEPRATVSELLENSEGASEENTEDTTGEIRVHMSTISGLPADAVGSQESTHTESQDAVHQVMESPGKYGTVEELRHTAEQWVATKTPNEDVQLMKSEVEESDKRKALLQFCNLGLLAMPALSRYFPGIVNVHPFAAEYKRLDVTEYSDALFCLSKLGPDMAAPILLAEIEHEDRVHRYSAIWGLSEMHVPSALPLLFQRVFDPELRIGYLAIDVLQSHRMEPGFAETLSALRRLLISENIFHQKRAILAATQFRDRDSVSTLIELLGDDNTEIVNLAVAALIEITKNDFGRSKRRWKSWVEQNSEAKRMDWLIAGLSHKAAHVRKSAQKELNTLTGEYLDYQFDASRSARAAGVSRWEEWWARHSEESKWRG